MKLQREIFTEALQLQEFVQQQSLQKGEIVAITKNVSESELPRGRLRFEHYELWYWETEEKTI